MEEISFHEMEEHHHEAHSAQMEFDINKFIIAVLSLGALGWIIEKRGYSLYSELHKKNKT
ncbi:MAG: hypothetical protein MZV70_76720 [Desulfobacterales bacterium]|nr:hypothetical protein [Desulfobacterales bacterium]